MNRQLPTNNTNKNIEELARIFANKAPKETTYNNTKTNKYFSTRTINEPIQRETVKDDLLHGIQNIYINTNPFEPRNSISKSHHRSPSKVLIVDKSIVYNQ
jgi:hypothetical protein